MSTTTKVTTMKSVFAVLVLSTGNIAFFPNYATQGEILASYPSNEVIYIPNFQLEEGDVLNYCGEEFYSFEALFEACGYHCLNETFIFADNSL